MSSNRTLLLLASLALGGCMGSFGNAPGDSDGGRTVRRYVCPVDPDCAIVGNCEQYTCPEYWICEDLPNGEKKCINPGPDYPDDNGDWSCEDVGGSTVCRRPGTTLPDSGGGSAWYCEVQAEFVVCIDSTPSYPDSGGGQTYNCYFENEFRICESGDNGGWTCYDTETGRQCRTNNPEYPDDREWTCYDNDGSTFCQTPGGTLPDGGGATAWFCEVSGEFVVCRDDTPDYPDEGGATPWNCRFGDEFRVCDETPTGTSECVPGTQRWCDDAVYCSWGKQTCLPDGTWGACVEPTLTASGLADRPNNDCGCRYFYFHAACCEDQSDRNGDGQPDCLIPAAHTAPACPSDGSLCSFCDTHGDCGGDLDLCVFRPDGYAMCSRDCASAPCPTGYTCQAISSGTSVVNQCVPDSGTCG